MKAYTSFYDDVLPEVPGCTPALALHHIKRACNDFYERSLLSRKTLAAIDIDNTVSTYQLQHPDPTNFSIAKVLVVEYEGRQLAPVTLEWLNTAPSAWDRFVGDQTIYSWRTQAGTPRWYVQPAIDTLTLVAVPDHDTTGGLIATIADSPNYAGSGVDDSVFEYSEEISAGAKFRLQRMPMKPWSNPSAAALNSEIFEQAIGAAAAQVTKGWGRAPLRTRAWG